MFSTTSIKILSIMCVNISQEILWKDIQKLVKVETIDV